MNYTIVISAAGAGSRFKGSQYEDPKPFIPVSGFRSMVELVAHKMSVDKFVHVIVQNRHRDYLTRLSGLPADKIIVIPPMIEAGPVGSIVMGLSSLSVDDTGLLLLDADSFLTSTDREHVTDRIGRALGDLPDSVWGAVVTVLSEKNSKHEASVGSHDRNPWILEGGVHEGEHLNTGIYWFRSFHQFRAEAFRLWNSPAFQTKELKISDILNHMRLTFGNSITQEIFLPSTVKFVNLGTPELLEEYQDTPDKDSTDFDLP